MRTHVCHGDVQKFAADIVKAKDSRSADVHMKGGHVNGETCYVLNGALEKGQEKHQLTRYPDRRGRAF